MRHVALVRDPIDAEALARLVLSDACGAVCTFVGTVRNEQDGSRRLDALDYHAYEDMAIEQMQQIRRKAIESFEIADAAIWHRLGKLTIGETSIAVVVASAHRATAFEACRWIIEQVKADVPIWKQDVWNDGTRTWVEPA